MSRTYKDQPDWVKARRTGHIDANHGYRCENNEYKRSHRTYSKYTVVTEPHWHLVDVYEKRYHPQYDWTVTIKLGKKWVYSSTEEEHREYYVVSNDQPCDFDPSKNPDHHYCTYSYDPPGGVNWWYNEVGQAERKLYDRQERTYVRDKMKRAKDDYNVNGDTDIEPATRRNPSGLWGGGWYW